MTPPIFRSAAAADVEEAFKGDAEGDILFRDVASRTIKVNSDVCASAGYVVLAARSYRAMVRVRRRDKWALVVASRRARARGELILWA